MEANDFNSFDTSESSSGVRRSSVLPVAAGEDSEVVPCASSSTPPTVEAVAENEWSVSRKRKRPSQSLSFVSRTTSGSDSSVPSLVLAKIFQPWVIRTYGDRAKTKTITLKKQARIIRTLRGQEMNNPDSSKFRFWVKTKGFTMSRPGNFRDVFTYQNIPENDGCILYAPSGGMEPGQPFKKVAVVENFFDIIYGIHVSLGSRATRHAGQKRTYRTITETYAFLPREAVTKFLSLCSQCSKLITKVSSPRKETKPVADDQSSSAKCEKTANVLPELASDGGQRPASPPLPYYELLQNLYESAQPNGAKRDLQVQSERGRKAKSTSPVTVSSELVTEADGAVVNPVPKPEARRSVSEVHRQDESGRISEGKPLVGLNNNFTKRKAAAMLHNNNNNKDSSLSMPFSGETTENNGSTTNSTPGEDAYAGLIKDADKFKLMLLAWNYQNSAAGKSQNGTEGPDLATMTNLWQQYQNALAMTGKSTFSQAPISERQSSPIEQQDETNSSEQKDEDDLSEDDSEDRLEATVNDPERLKAFNMFVRLFVDENLDRIIPISKQPKEKIQAIIDSCTRQFPEFAERARKRIRTYLKSCRRNKKTREGWENTSRPTPAHLTSVQAEQILAVACENESLNAKRMRIGLEPISQTVSQPAAVSFMSSESPTAVPSMYQTITREQESTSVSTIKSEPMTSVPKISPVPSTPTPDMTQMKLNIPSASASSTPTIPTTVPTISNFHDYNTGFSNRSQHYQNFMNSVNSSSTSSGATTNTTMSASGTGKFRRKDLSRSAPTDLSMKRPILAHKLNSAEITAVKQLVTGYRESAAFLMRSADELENLLLQQQ
ncbi:nucleolar protein 4 [Anopheles bellator]|uniref:nucleolar protein 4 n=1 Tax=Anopheles bellator TaxID=139047 RepID=UPI002649BE4C|nr:nucleolar protein 4 [Anopheles bellator]